MEMLQDMRSINRLNGVISELFETASIADKIYFRPRFDIKNFPTRSYFLPTDMQLYPMGLKLLFSMSVPRISPQKHQLFEKKSCVEGLENFYRQAVGAQPKI
jgi:hypothetical protein